MVRNMLKFFLFTSLLALTLSYERCGNGSYCPNAYVCCKKEVGGYTCCEQYLSCCDGGKTCCPRNGYDQMMKYRHDIIVSEALEATSMGLLEVQKTDANKVALIIDGFLNTTQFYTYTQSLSPCAKEAEEVVLDLVQAIRDLENKNVTAVEFIVDLIDIFYERLSHIKYALSKCETAEKEVVELLENIATYIEEPGYFRKVLENGKDHFFMIIEYTRDMVKNINHENYRQCGVNLGYIFNALFKVSY